MKKLAQLFKYINSIDIIPFPMDYDAVIRGDAMWSKPLEILGYANRFTVLGGYMPEHQQWWVDREIDMNHPKCWTCGKFIKRNRSCETCN